MSAEFHLAKGPLAYGPAYDVMPDALSLFMLLFLCLQVPSRINLSMMIVHWSSLRKVYIIEWLWKFFYRAGTTISKHHIWTSPDYILPDANRTGTSCDPLSEAVAYLLVLNLIDAAKRVDFLKPPMGILERVIHWMPIISTWNLRFHNFLFIIIVE